MIELALFDLDGTFADTAMDLGAALNRLRTEHGFAPLPLDDYRAVTSHGVRGLLKVGFGIAPEDEGYGELAQRFLAYYAEAICVGTCMFPGIPELLDALEARGIKWGIVTNKSQRYTLPVLAGLGVDRRAACIVSGDSAPRAKPYPDPLLLAAHLSQTDPRQAVYAGDDLRDVQAGYAAGMYTIAVTYGYLGTGPAVETWGAHALADHPGQLLEIIDRWR
jgi:phosphoglycolate phosphatase